MTLAEIFFLVVLFAGVFGGTALGIVMGRTAAAPLPPTSGDLGYSHGFKDGVAFAQGAVFSEPALIVDAYSKGVRAGRERARKE